MYCMYMYVVYGVTNDAHNSYIYEVIERKNIKSMKIYFESFV